MAVQFRHFVDDGEDSDDKAVSDEEKKCLLQKAEQRFSNSIIPVPESSESAHQQKYDFFALAVTLVDWCDQC